MGTALRNPKRWPFAVCLLPRLIVLGAGVGIGAGLGANPIEFITHSTGTWTLVTLSVTPLRRLTGRADLIRYRRMLGLFAFFTPACISSRISGSISSLIWRTSAKTSSSVPSSRSASPPSRCSSRSQQPRAAP